MILCWLKYVACHDIQYFDECVSKPRRKAFYLFKPITCLNNVPVGVLHD